MHKFKLLRIVGSLYAILLVGSLMAGPAFAKQAQNGNQVSACHYQDIAEFGPGPDGILGDDPLTPGDESADDVLLSDEGWGEISVNRHAVAKHEANHFDSGADRGDFEIADATDQTDCDALVAANPSALP